MWEIPELCIYILWLNACGCDVMMSNLHLEDTPVDDYRTIDENTRLMCGLLGSNRANLTPYISMNNIMDEKQIM